MKVLRKTQLTYVVLLIAAPLFSMSGCSSKQADGPLLAPVTGVVTKAGKPVPYAEVQLHSVSNPAGISRATTNEEGKFNLTYGNNKQGAIVGECRVVVVTYDKLGPSPKEGLPGPPLSPPKEIQLQNLVVDKEGKELKLELPL